MSDDTFSQVGAGAPFSVSGGATISFTLSGTFAASVALQRAVGGGTAWQPVLSSASPLTGSHVNESTSSLYRWACTDFTSGQAQVSTTVIEGIPQGSISWDAVLKPAFVAAGDTEEEARQAIGAGTSDLEIGTTATTAKAGNYTPTVADLGLSQTAQNVLNAADQDGMQSQMGGTSTGKLLFTAQTAESAVDAIQAISRTKAPTNAVRGGVLQVALPTIDTGAPVDANDLAAIVAALISSGVGAPPP